MLGARATLGRLFTADEHLPGAAPVVLLSEKTWKERFNADPAVLWRGIRFIDATRTVVGVLPAGSSWSWGRREPDFWIPSASR